MACAGGPSTTLHAGINKDADGLTKPRHDRIQPGAPRVRSVMQAPAKRAICGIAASQSAGHEFFSHNPGRNGCFLLTRFM
jgi:hypothetical protein